MFHTMYGAQTMSVSRAAFFGQEKANNLNEQRFHIIMNQCQTFFSLRVRTCINPLHNVPETGTHAMGFQ